MRSQELGSLPQLSSDKVQSQTVAQTDGVIASGNEDFILELMAIRKMIRSPFNIRSSHIQCRE